MDVIFLLLGLVIGIAATWFFFKSKTKSEDSIGKERETLLQTTVNELKEQLTAKESAIISLSSQLSAKTADFNNLSQRLAEQKADVEKLQEKFAIEFKNLANEIMDEKSKKFTEQNKVNLDQILKPLHDRIKDFEKKVDETYDKEAQQRFSLKEEVKRLAELNQMVSKEANNLVKALKGESKTQGNWGEVILENILERSGLVRGREYVVQESFVADDGRRFQPDVIVHYPGNRCVIVDSKVSLTAYERYASATTTEEQELAIKEHILSVKRHVDELNSKNYQHLADLKSLDFVMMFMPIEPAFLLAIHNDPSLWNYAYDKRILIISPTNLIASLKMIESMWRQEYQNLNAEEIARQSGALYDKFEGLVTDLIELGKRLNATQDFYKGSMNKLTDGKGSILGRIENIRKLGAKTKKVLPQGLLNRIEEEKEEEI